ncbi:MAG: HEAT repeat domain-containing protein [Candidatus Abyssobacteria bacterium SURF_17]|uniref:HEAT repeat domain-containing protein n=1 Tax=Candidatus Abyssobacteria bacterium SURF_17 TaxID=2093361 RepID=A0A419ETW0_9BACT|nr:MAG: HEAT repeat domain-containing protein [Candidatus Abyssubacteria bacterium SURF_17]
MADTDALIQKLKAGDYYSRSTAARALGKIGGEKAVAALIEALKDEDDWVKEYAAEALGTLQCAEAVRPLGELLSLNNYKVRSSAAEALGRIGGEQARMLLEPLKDDPDSWVREAAINALGALGRGKPRAKAGKPSSVSRAPSEFASARSAAAETEPGLSLTEASSEPEEHLPRSPRRPAGRVPRTPEEIVEIITRGTSITSRQTRSGFLLRVPVAEGRHQKVRLKFDSTDEDGSPLIQLFTVIGPAKPEHYRWALKLNPSFSYGAIGLVSIDEKEFFAIMNTLLEENVDPRALEKSVWTIARKGDALEQKLIQKDLW